MAQSFSPSTPGKPTTRGGISTRFCGQQSTVKPRRRTNFFLAQDSGVPRGNAILPPKTRELLCRRSQIWEEGFKTLAVSKFEHLRSKTHQMRSTGGGRLSLPVLSRNPVHRIHAKVTCVLPMTQKWLKIEVQTFQGNQQPVVGSRQDSVTSRAPSSLDEGAYFSGTRFGGSLGECHFAPQDSRIALSAVANLGRSLQDARHVQI